MSTYALIVDNIVVNIVVADADWIATQPGNWHEYDDDRPAGIGWTWRADVNRAQPPEPAKHDGWDEEAWQWIIPPLEP
jgi:hypothetical protein